VDREKSLCVPLTVALTVSPALCLPPLCVSLTRLCPYCLSQILQWQFMAAPNHPVLVNLCRTLVAQAQTQFHEDSTRDTLDRTGPGPFSDAVLSYREETNGGSTVCTSQ
jgi:hypothetical protein